MVSELSKCGVKARELPDGIEGNFCSFLVVLVYLLVLHMLPRLVLGVGVIWFSRLPMLALLVPTLCRSGGPTCLLSLSHPCPDRLPRRPSHCYEFRCARQCRAGCSHRAANGGGEDVPDLLAGLGVRYDSP
jgi:hypothetical protein